MRSNSVMRARAVYLVATLVVLQLAACAAIQRHTPPAREEPASWDEETFARKETPSFVVATDARGVPRDTVIGEVTTYRVRKGDTLLDVARWFDLGYNEIVAANPGVDPWVPEPGTDVVVPGAFVLPCCTYDGIVVNLPEMRLYHYRRSKKAKGGQIEIATFPVGLGRDDRRTPRGTYRVGSKTENPQWNIPPRIRQEHIAERGDKRTFIPGGAPDNPLGTHRISLADSLYAIHGTNIPWGVGMMVSHGCLRLYPEDIVRLYPEVKVGTKVQFVYQPVKVGTRDGDVWVEAHPDVYRLTRSLKSDARTALSRRKLERRVDPGALDDTVAAQLGVPVIVEAKRDAPPGVEAKRDAKPHDSFDALAGPVYKHRSID
jgi:L,D-transpeptidase ErfK/SrfK